MTPVRIVGVIAAALLVVAACGTGQAPSPTPSTAGSGTSGGGSSAAPAGSGTAGSDGSGSSGQPITGTVDPCSLLTQAEVAAVLGQAVGPGSSTSDPHACDWTYMDPSDGLTLVSATATTNINAATFAKLCGTHSAVVGIAVIPVSGIGDSACITESNGLGTSLAFQKAGRAYTIGVLGLGKLHDVFNNAASEAAEKVLATEAAGRV